MFIDGRGTLTMYGFTKMVLKVSTVLAVLSVAAALLVVLSGSDAGLVAPWLSLIVIIIWIPIAALCLLVMAMTFPKGPGASMSQDRRNPIHWAMSSIFLLWGAYSIYLLSRLLLNTKAPGLGIPHSAVLVSSFCAVVAIAAGVTVLFNRARAKWLFLILGVTLLIRLAMYFAPMLGTLNIMQIVVSSGLSGLTAILALATYFYLWRAAAPREKL